MDWDPSGCIVALLGWEDAEGQETSEGSERGFLSNGERARLAVMYG